MCQLQQHSDAHVYMCDTVQKLLSTFKNLDAVQAYDGAQSIASIPGDLHSVQSLHIPWLTHLPYLLAHSLPNFHVTNNSKHCVSVCCGVVITCYPLNKFLSAVLEVKSLNGPLSDPLDFIHQLL